MCAGCLIEMIFEMSKKLKITKNNKQTLKNIIRLIIIFRLHLITSSLISDFPEKERSLYFLPYYMFGR